MRILVIALCALAFSISAAEARYRDTRPYNGWATGHCKRASCYAKHPGGTYHYPYHYGHRRR